MIGPIGKTHLRDELTRTLGGVVTGGLGCWRNKRGDQYIFKDRALRQQTVVLEHEADCRVAECGQFVGR